MTVNTRQHDAPRADPYHWLPQSCPICGEAPARRLGRRGGEAHRQRLGVECVVWRCETCRLVFPNPMPVPVHGMAQHYTVPPEEYFRNHDSAEKERSAARLLDRALSLVGARGSLLDIGAGRGELLRRAAMDGWRAVGIEPSSTFADYASQCSGAPIHRDPVERCGFDTASFDVVVLAAVLEHLYNPDATIREIARILRPGGVLFVDVPNEEGLYFRVGNLYQRLRGRDWVVNLAPTFEPFHTFGFGPRALRALLSKHALQPVVWQVYAGRSVLPDIGGATGALECLAAFTVTAASRFLGLGAYIEAWARKA